MPDCWVQKKTRQTAHYLDSQKATAHLNLRCWDQRRQMVYLMGRWRCLERKTKTASLRALCLDEEILTAYWMAEDSAPKTRMVSSLAPNWAAETMMALQSVVCWDQSTKMAQLMASNSGAKTRTACLLAQCLAVAIQCVLRDKNEVVKENCSSGCHTPFCTSRIGQFIEHQAI